MPPTKELGEVTNTLVIDRSTLKDIGYYFCYGSYAGGRKYYLSSSRLKVYGMCNHSVYIYIYILICMIVLFITFALHKIKFYTIILF